MTSLKHIDIKKRIALVVQDKFKAELINWVYANKAVLIQHDIIAAGSTADIIAGTLGTSVVQLLSSELGGYQQLSDMMMNCEVDMAIFFCDPFETSQSYEELKTLQAVAESCNMVIASNRVTADFVINSSYMNEVHPGYGNDDAGYLKRKESVLSN